MRTFTVDRSVDIVKEVFDRYVEPVARTYMKGEIPQVLLTIHRQGTKESDWLAQVRFKETSTVSLFRCDIYLEDIYWMCRRWRIYLQTEEIFPLIVLYFIMHPLYQSQWNDFGSDLVKDYDNMMIGADRQVREFIKKNFSMRGRYKKLVLDVMHLQMMKFANDNDPDIDKKLQAALKRYKMYSYERYPDVYGVAALRRAHTCMVDSNGLIVLERLHKKE